MTWDYIAGFFDGEGTAGVWADGNWSLSIVNTNRDVLEEIRDFVGGGRITTRRSLSLGTKAIHAWKVSDARTGLIVATELARRSVIKREVLERVIEHVSGVTPLSANWGAALNIDAAELRRLYWDEELSTGEIAAMIGMDANSIIYAMKRKGIPVRSRSEFMALAHARGRHKGRYSSGGFPMFGVNPETVRKLYWDDGLSVREIATRFGLTREGMRAYMIRRGIPFRTRAEANRLRPTAS